MDGHIDQFRTLSFFDWFAVAALLCVVLAVAVIARLKQKTSEDFFLAGRSMGIVIVLFSIFATLFSTISFVSVPGEAYQHGLMFYMISFLSLIFYPLGIWLFLRFFFLAETFTAYEYLERRYNLSVRLVGAALYIIVRLFYSGVVLYAASQIFESLLGWPPVVTIIGVGAFTVIYTTTGGMKAVMINDTIQCFVIIAGISAILIKLTIFSDSSIFNIFKFAQENDHLFGYVRNPEFYRINLQNRYNFWLFLFSAITVPLLSLSSDQSVIQRLLASKGYSGAKKAVLINALMSIPITGMLWIIGLGLFYYYNNVKSVDNSVVTSDKVLGYFINTELPTPLPGLITAALLAALMSTIDSTVNCISNVIYRDWFVRLGLSGRRVFVMCGEMNVCRLLSALTGIASISLAVLLAVGSKGIVSSIYEINTIWTGFWGVLFISFLLGVICPRVSSTGILTGLISGGLCCLIVPIVFYYNEPAEGRIAFSWLTLPGFIVAGVLGLGISIICPNKKDLTNLTLWTLSEDNKRKKLN
jgi:SSS family transporter